MSSKRYDHYSSTGQDDPVRPLDLAYPGFLNRRDMECLAKCTIELKEIAIERPKYINIALQENLAYLLRTLSSARRRHNEIRHLFEEISDEVWRYGHLYHRLQETIKSKTGIAASIAGWAQWTDGTIYEVNPPDVRVTPITFNWGQIINAGHDGEYHMTVDQTRGSPITIPWQSSLRLTERMMYDPNIIVITTGTIIGKGANQRHIEEANNAYKDALFKLIGGLSISYTDAAATAGSGVKKSSS